MIAIASYIEHVPLSNIMKFDKLCMHGDGTACFTVCGGHIMTWKLPEAQIAACLIIGVIKSLKNYDYI
jgi:hypothetical protein